MSRLEFPLAKEVNPHLAACRQTSKAWAISMGMLAGPGAPDPIGIWDEALFDANDGALTMSLSYPDAAYEALVLLTDIAVWGFYFNDFLTIVYGHPRDFAGARAYIDRLIQCMPETGAPVLVPLNPAERALADWWVRVSAKVFGEVRDAIRTQIVEYLQVQLWEFNHRVDQRIPDFVDYIEMRRCGYGGALLCSLLHLAVDIQLSPELLASRSLTELLHCAEDVCGLTNDLISFRKEQEFEAKSAHVVPAVERLLGCDRTTAVDMVTRLLHARIARLQDVIANELPVVMDEFSLDEDGRARVMLYAKRIERIAYGQFLNNVVSPRYHESEARKMSPLHHLQRRRPKGFGAVAMQVGPILSAVETTARASQPAAFVSAAASRAGLGMSALRIESLHGAPLPSAPVAVPEAPSLRAQTGKPEWLAAVIASLRQGSASGGE